MYRTRPFDQYIPLAQEELDLPLYDVIQNLNWLITSALGDPSRVAIFMDKYEKVFHLIGENGTSHLACYEIFKNYFDGMFDQIVFYPINTCPLSSIIPQMLPPYIREVWAIITATQLLLPCVVNVKKQLERATGTKQQNSIIICIIDRYLKENYKYGFNCIGNSVAAHCGSSFDSSNHVFKDGNVQANEVLADSILNGFTRVSLMPTHHVNMTNAVGLVDRVIGDHPSLRPAVLPPTNMF